MCTIWIQIYTNQAKHSKLHKSSLSYNIKQLRNSKIKFRKELSISFAYLLLISEITEVDLF